MKLIVGLGNPGKSYYSTRHNAGRLFVEYLAKRLNCQMFIKQKETRSWVTQGSWDGVSVTLAFPDLYMNQSGEAVFQLRQSFIQEEQELLVVVDDLALPFGKWRLRREGSDGGHNGLKSIEANLRTAAYSRLRFGIGHPREIADLEGFSPSVERYVLSSFDKREFDSLEETFKTGFEACRFWVMGDFEKAVQALTL